MPADPRSTILIVEDDPGIAILQRRRLERAGFAASVAGDVESALSILLGGGVSLVVVDYRLGETTGLDLHRRMKANGVDVPVILVSGSLEDATVVEALRAGVRDIVVKTPDYLDYLPDAVRGVLSQAAGATDLPQPETHRHCVLVVEDDPGTALLERRQLERAGYSVKVAATADEALHAIREGKVELAVLDLRLPGGTSGIELYERAKAEGVAIPAILVTGFADQTVAIRAMRAGIRDFVPKSTDYLEYLPTAVDRLISQVRVERRLAESELRLASIVGTTMDAIVMCDAQSRIVLFNRSAEEMFGCEAASALGRPLQAFVPGLTLGSAQPDGVRVRRELDAVPWGGGSLPIEVSVTDVQIHDRRLFTVIARDITERRLAEEERRDADRRKDEFLGMLAHELRNPLAAIMNAAEVLHRTLGEVPAQKLIGVVRRQTRALARMVDDLLDMSRVTLGKIQLTREPLLLGEVVTRAVEALRDAAARAGLQLTAEVADSDGLWVQGDATRLEQVVTNLVTNAIKFTPAGGRIMVTAAAEDRDAVVRVRDTGIGIPPALLPRVFDLFVQGDTSLDRSRSGLGIGLALVRQIMVLHGGTVTAGSQGAGAGSEFVVRLPLAAQDLRAPADVPTPDSQADRRVRVIVVDDQRDVADAVAMLIESLGHEARAVYDGGTALALAREERPDAMFVDIGMPDMTGYELAERVRSDPGLATLHLVALTGYGRDEDRARVAAAGFDLHITKPVTDTDLYAALADIATHVS